MSRTQSSSTTWNDTIVFWKLSKRLFEKKEGLIPYQKSLKKRELYAILSFYRLDYCKFVTLSTERSLKVRDALDSLIGKIVIDFSERVLQLVLAMKGKLTIMTFLLACLREC